MIGGDVVETDKEANDSSVQKSMQANCVVSRRFLKDLWLQFGRRSKRRQEGRRPREQETESKKSLFVAKNVRNEQAKYEERHSK